MRVGIAGVGRIGTMHARLLAGNALVSHLTICDPLPGRAAHLADELAVASTDSVAELLETDLDAVVIATSTASHADLVEQFCHRRVPVFCEKPVAMDVGRTVQVARVEFSSGTLVHVGFQRRFDPGYLELKRQVVAGELGEVRRMHLVSADPAPPPEAFIRTSGGIFRDLLIHDFDLLRWLTGQEVVQAWATGSARGAPYFAEAGDVDEAVVVLTLADGTLASVHGSRCNGAGYDVRMEVAGTRATSVAGLSARSPLWASEPGEPIVLGPAWTQFSDRFAAAYAAELTAFLTAANDGGSSPCSVADGLEALLVAEAAALSLQTERPVQIADIRPGGPSDHG